MRRRSHRGSRGISGCRQAAASVAAERRQQKSKPYGGEKAAAWLSRLGENG